MKIRIIKSYKEYRAGERVEVTPNVGFGLVDSGYAVVDKEMTSRDTKTKVVKRGRSR